MNKLASDPTFSFEEGLVIPEIGFLINRSVLVGGKKFRPLLVESFGRMLGADAQSCQNLAVAAEWVHAAFLAHDDVIDEASKRRSLPTLNSTQGNRKAILSGDALLAQASARILQENNIPLMEAFVSMLRETVEGEWLQNEGRGVSDVDLAHIENVGVRKTGVLLSWCVSAPAYLLRLPPLALELCDSIGRNMGIAFQLIDDTLDYSAEAEKDYAKDFKMGLINAVTYYMIQYDPSVSRAFVKGKDPLVERVWTDEVLTRAIQSTKEKAQFHIDVVRDNLEHLFAEFAPKTQESQAELNRLNGLLVKIIERKN